MKEFKYFISSPHIYLFHLITKYSNLSLNLFFYLIYFLVFFLSSSISTLLLDKILQSTNIILILTTSFLLSSLSTTLRHFSFFISNFLLKSFMWKLSVRDILINISNFHPLWLTSSSVSGGTLRENMIDVGLGGLSKTMNRLSYFIPMIFELCTSFWRFGVLNISMLLSFIMILGSLETILLHPLQQMYSKERDDIVKGKRRRFLQVEKLEYSKLQKHRTRSKEEYKGVVNRLVKYRSYFEDCTLNIDFKIGLISSVSDITKELIGFGLIFWIYFQNDVIMFLFDNDDGDNGDDNRNNINNNINTINTMTIILLIISMRNIVKQFSQVIEHKRYTEVEMSEFQPLSSLLQTSFSSEDISSRVEGDRNKSDIERLDKYREKLHNYFNNQISLNKHRIELDGAYATSLPSKGVHFVMISEKLSFVGGEIIFISGSNGTGKVILLYLYFI